MKSKKTAARPSAHRTTVSLPGALTYQALGRETVRIFPRSLDAEALPPSLVYEAGLSVVDEEPSQPSQKLTFAWSSDLFAVTVQLGRGTHVYGMGEHRRPLALNGTESMCWNSDAWGVGPKAQSMYQSHPWMLAVRQDGSAFGVWAETTYACRITALKTKATFSTHGQAFPLVYIEGASAQDVLQKLTDLTGRITMPPRWALGYQQCRWSYYPDSRVREIADEFRARRIPCDVIWLDIHYMNGYRVFTFDRETFSDPKGLNDYLHENGFKSVWMIDPGVKKEKGYPVYDRGQRGDHWVKDAQGANYAGDVWPGECRFPDYTRPKTRKWWASLYKEFMATGVDGVWNDMNEPSIFLKEKREGVPDYVGNTMPLDNLHRGGGGLPEGTHAQYHNVYGMLMVRATREGIVRANPEKRPFVLTRANYLGGHRYAATWTGDNKSTWEHLKLSVPCTLNMGLSGQPFVGPDIGGFGGNGTSKMFVRWMGFGVLLPFARAHAAKGTRNKEPWAFGKRVEKSCRTAIERRYRLIPYFYTLFHESSKNGLPVARPTFFADPTNHALREEYQSFLIGDNLLVQAQLDEEGGYQHPEPAGVWREIRLVGENPKKDINQPVLKQRAGSIVPLGKVVQNLNEPSLDPLTLVVCLDEQGRAEGTLYEDAGDGYEFAKGQYRLSTFEAKTQGDVVTVRRTAKTGRLQLPQQPVHVELITHAGVRAGRGDIDRGVEICKPSISC